MSDNDSYAIMATYLDIFESYFIPANGAAIYIEISLNHSMKWSIFLIKFVYAA